MPAIYAHCRFGKDVLALLPAGDREPVLKYPDLYHIGLHGPDILFYYRPLSANEINRAGNQAHTIAGREYFSGMWEIVKQSADPEPCLAYLYGFLCHFALDSACHGYINETARKTRHSHSELETELDRYFMIADGRDPMTYRPTGHIHPTEWNSRVIAAFFPGIGADEIRESLHTMILIEDLWVASNPVKRGMVVSALKLAGQFASRKDLMRSYDASAECVGLLPPIVEMYERAVPRAVRFITEFAQTAQGNLPWDPCFELPFDPQHAGEAPAD